MPSGYEGRHVVVTGCASGIGAATARALVQAGAVVHGLDRREAEAGLARFDLIDLADPDAIEAAAASIGLVDALFNCAGLAPTRPPLDVIRVNFLGTRLLTERVAARMAPGGAIVSVSSNGGLDWQARLPLLREFLAQPDYAGGLAWAEARLDGIGNAYRFAKEALTVWTLAQSAVLIRRGIRINCTSPGAVSTPMLAELEERLPAAAIDLVAQPIGRRSPPEEQAGPLLFLNGDGASYVNGVDLAVDGGFAAARALA